MDKLLMEDEEELQFDDGGEKVALRFEQVSKERFMLPFEHTVSGDF